MNQVNAALIALRSKTHYQRGIRVIGLKGKGSPRLDNQSRAHHLQDGTPQSPIECLKRRAAFVPNQNRGARNGGMFGRVHIHIKEVFGGCRHYHGFINRISHYRNLCSLRPKPNFLPEAA
jgi:hypothetical protein